MADDKATADRIRSDGAITISDVARLAGVSKKTVSRVVNNEATVSDETRQKVQKVIAETWFVPNPQARALAFRRSFLVGLVYDNPNPQYVVNMQRGVLDALDNTDYQLVLQPCDRNSADYPDRILSFVSMHRPHGLILTPSVSEDEALTESLRRLDCDYVVVASVPLDIPQRNIRTHDRQGARLAAEHLAQLGHTSIGHIHGPPLFRSVGERLEGFREGLEAHGLELDPRYIREGAYNFASGVACGRDLLSREDRPTAIFTGNDEMAVGVYVAAREAGLRIPEDLSIVGFDDTPIAERIWPPLTTVRSPIREIGRAAARLLIGRKEPEFSDLSEHLSYALDLMTRQSTSAPLKL